MGNFLKYSTSQPTREGLRRGSLILGTGDEEYGPTSTTGYLNSLNIPGSGWVVYTLGLNNTPIGWTASDTSELFAISGHLGGTGTQVIDVNKAVAYICSLENTWILDSAPSDIITDGLIYYSDAGILSSYPGSANDVMDVSGNGVDSISALKNGTTFNSGNGGTWVFDGTDDYMQIMSNGFGTFNLQEFSLDMWFKVDVVNNYNVLFSYDNVSHSPPYYAVHVRTNSNGSIGFYYNFNGGNSFAGSVSPSGVISANTWYNVCITYKSDLQQVFINGEQQDQNSNSGPLTYYNQEVWVGRSNFGSGYTNGNVGLVKYYDRELTESEIVQNYNALSSRFP